MRNGTGRDRDTDPGAQGKIIALFFLIVGAVMAAQSMFALVVAGPYALPTLIIGMVLLVRGLQVLAGAPGRKKTDKERPERGARPQVRPNPARTRAQDHDHIPSMELSTQGRLEQLKTLKEAGLLTEAEYRERRDRITRGE